MIDLDKVVFDCNSIAYNFANRYFTTSTINRKLRYKIVDAEIARHYKNKLSFLKFCNTEHLTPVDNSIKIIKKWKNEGHLIHFVSTRPYIKSFQKMTLDWFDKNNINFDSLIFACTNKPRYCFKNNYDIIIDDNLTNCIYSTMFNINAIWLTHNTDKLKSINLDVSLFPAHNWNEIDQIVQYLHQPSSSIEELCL